MSNPIIIGHFGTLLHSYGLFYWPLFFVMYIVLLPTSIAQHCHRCCEWRMRG